MRPKYRLDFKKILNKIKSDFKAMNNLIIKFIFIFFFKNGNININQAAGLQASQHRLGTKTADLIKLSCSDLSFTL